jgi:hypothetical protein
MEDTMAADPTSDTGRNLDARQRQLETLDRLAQRFGTSMSRALNGGAADGDASTRLSPRSAAP